MTQWAVTSQSSGMVLFGVHAHQAKQGRAGAGQRQGPGKEQCEAPGDKPDLCRPG